MKRLTPLAGIAGLAIHWFLSPLQAANAAVADGILTSVVSNAATANLLEGAKVDLPGLDRSTLTDHTGRFQISVPAGAHAVVVAYIGLDPARGEVTITAGQRVIRDFNLSTGIYQLAV